MSRERAERVERSDRELLIEMNQTIRILRSEVHQFNYGHRELIDKLNATQQMLSNTMSEIAAYRAALGGVAAPEDRS